MGRFEKVCFVGLGYIGLPSAAVVAQKNIEVVGVDINQSIVEKINQGEIHIIEPGLADIVQKVVQQGTLRATTHPEVSDAYIIVVPTPFLEHYQPDISYVEAATRGVLPLLKRDDLFIIESTSPVGTTEKMADLIFKTRPELKGEISIAYCPERVLPGNVLYEIIKNDRVVGGIDEASTSRACAFYSEFVTGTLHRTDSRTAEMCKLTENASRDVQIAFANELSIICDKAGIDVWELISFANKHPRVKIMQPGCGVGGHCIAVDPYFIVADFPRDSQIILKARETNNYKAFWCVEKIMEAVSGFNKMEGRAPKVALLGLAFKPNIDDLRESPAVFIANKISKSGKATVLIAEPNIPKHNEFNLVDYNYAFENAEIVVFLVAHKQFFNLSLTNCNKIIFDFCGVQHGS